MKAASKGIPAENLRAPTLIEVLDAYHSLRPLNLKWSAEEQNEWWSRHTAISRALTQATTMAPLSERRGITA